MEFFFFCRKELKKVFVGFGGVFIDFGECLDC